VADDPYDRYIESMRSEGLLDEGDRTTGTPMVPCELNANGHTYRLCSEATGWGDERVWVERDGVVAWERFETMKGPDD